MKDIIHLHTVVQCSVLEASHGSPVKGETLLSLLYPSLGRGYFFGLIQHLFCPCPRVSDEGPHMYAPKLIVV